MTPAVPYHCWVCAMLVASGAQPGTASEAVYLVAGHAVCLRHLALTVAHSDDPRDIVGEAATRAGARTVSR